MTQLPNVGVDLVVAPDALDVEVDEEIQLSNSWT